MKIKIKALGRFRRILGKEMDLDLPEGSGVSDLLKILSSRHADLNGALFSGDGVKDDVNIVVNGRNIESLQGLSTPLSDGDEVAVFTAAIGG